MMLYQYCCPECFGDQILRDELFPTLDPTIGECSFCHAAGTQLVEPAQLSPYFELLASAYEPRDTGRPMVEWFRDDWMLFNKLTSTLAGELLCAIFGDDFVRRSFVPAVDYKPEALHQWKLLRDEIRYANRWVFQNDIDRDRLGELLDMLLARSLPRDWHRARIPAENQVFTIDDLGAPPPRSTRHGRANPSGIPYLYLSSLPDTAVAEVRPQPGESVYVARYAIDDIRAVDLRAPRELISPFILADANAICQLRADISLLERLGQDLMQPVRAEAAAIDYIPTQYLCELIKYQGFNGVVYQSSVNKGFNLALFDPKRAKPKNIVEYTVQEVDIKFAKKTPTET